MKIKKSKFPTGKVKKYLKKGEYYEVPPSAVQYYIDIGGECIGVCDTRFSPIIPISIVALVVIICGAVYFTKSTNKGSTLDDQIAIDTDNNITEGTDDDIVIKFNKYMSYTGGRVDVRLVNGKQESEVYITGSGVKSQAIKLKPHEEVYYYDIVLPKKINYGDLLDVKLTVKYGDKTVKYDCVIENIDNNEQDFENKVDFSEEEVIHE